MHCAVLFIDGCVCVCGEEHYSRVSRGFFFIILEERDGEGNLEVTSRYLEQPQP